MFKIEAEVDEIYELAASKSALQEFFANTENFAKYMPDIVYKIVAKGGNQTTWTLKIDISSGSSLNVTLDMANTKITESQINYEPVNETNDRLAIFIKLTGNNPTSVQFRLELRLQRKSSFDIHPLAGLLGEKAINKITQSHAEEIVKNFVKQAASGGKKK